MSCLDVVGKAAVRQITAGKIVEVSSLSWIALLDIFVLQRRCPLPKRYSFIAVFKHAGFLTLQIDDSMDSGFPFKVFNYLFRMGLGRIFTFQDLLGFVHDLFLSDRNKKAKKHW